MSTKPATLVAVVNDIPDRNNENKRQHHSDNGGEGQKKKTKQQERLERRERRSRIITIDELMAEATELARNRKYEEARTLYQKAMCMQIESRTGVFRCFSKIRSAYSNLFLSQSGKDGKSTEASTVLYKARAEMFLLSKAVAMQLANDGSRSEDAVETLTLIGEIILFENNKEIEAMEVYRQLLDIQRETLGKNHPDVANTLFHMAYCSNYKQCRNSNQANHETMEMYVKAVTIGLQLDGEDREDVVGMGMQWAEDMYIEDCESIVGQQPRVTRGEAVLKAIKGQVVKATDTPTEQVKQRQESMRTEKVLAIIAIVKDCLVLGRFIRAGGGTPEQAMFFYQHLLKAQVEALGADHPLIACTYLKIGIILCDDQSKYEEALLVFKKVLLVQREALGSRHEDVGLTYSYIGRVLSRQYKHEESIRNYRKALKIELETLGNRHPDVANTYFDLGRGLCELRGNVEDGQKLFKAALDILREVSEGDHDAVIDMEIDIARVYGMEWEDWVWEWDHGRRL